MTNRLFVNLGCRRVRRTSYTPAVTEWLARIDDDGGSAAAYRTKRAAVVVVAAAYVLFWAWLAFAVGFCVMLVGAEYLASGLTSSTSWNEPAGTAAGLVVGVLCAVVAGAIAASQAVFVWRHGSEQALNAVRARPADDAVDCRLLNVVSRNPAWRAAGRPRPPT